jgi:hypothetical protein
VFRSLRFENTKHSRSFALDFLAHSSQQNLRPSRTSQGDIAPTFDSPREQSSLLALPARAKRPEGRFAFVRVGRIELPSQPWEGRVLPLNDTRNVFNTTTCSILFIWRIGSYRTCIPCGSFLRAMHLKTAHKVLRTCIGTFSLPSQPDRRSQS